MFTWWWWRDANGRGERRGLVGSSSRRGSVVTASAPILRFRLSCAGRRDACRSIQASAQSDTKNLSYDIIICSLGARYKSYCANVSRSFFINPPKKVCHGP